VSSRTRPCDEATVAGRMHKADQFFEAAETVRELADDEYELGDACVTLYVHAGIAAADVICCVELKEHARGDDHNQALDLLERVRRGGRELANALRSLLGMKTRAGYSHRPVTRDDHTRARRQAERLLRAARDRRGGG
jgi:hypothetical protein